MAESSENKNQKGGGVSRYGWAVDGYGKCHLYKKGDVRVLFSGLEGVSGFELVWIYEDFGK